MKKEAAIGGLFVFMFTLYLVTISGSLVFAACPNVVGDYDITFDRVAHDPTLDTYEYEHVNGSLYITNQNACLFYGYLDVSHPTGVFVFTGVVDNTTVTLTFGDTGADAFQGILNGTLLNYDITSRRYKKIKFTVSELWTGAPDDSFGSAKGRATRR